MLMANDKLNQTPNMSDDTKRSPLQTFSNSEVQVNPKHWVPFGCPGCVLVGGYKIKNVYITNGNTDQK